jgi:hypothetical protein
MGNTKNIIIYSIIEDRELTWRAHPKRENLFYKLFISARPHVEVVQRF